MEEVEGGGKGEEGVEVEECGILVNEQGGHNSSTGTTSNARVTQTPIPYRFPSKDTPTVIDFGSMHPFTEEVGPTTPLPTSATALDFFLQMFTCMH